MVLLFINTFTTHIQLSVRGHSQVVSLEGGMVQDVKAPLVAQCHIQVRIVAQQLQDLYALLPYRVVQGCVPI